jgi:competence protein ComEA
MDPSFSSAPGRLDDTPRTALNRPGVVPFGADGRPSIANRWIRLRSDPRFGVAVLAIVAVAAGWFWYRAGVDDVTADTGAAVTSSSSVPATVGAPSTAGAQASGADPAAPAGPPGGRDAGASGTPAAPDAGGSATAQPPPIVVHVAGAVVNPGVYRLPAGARVEDAIVAAGGPVIGADVDALNRAQPLADGQRVGVPHVGEAPTAAGASAVGVSGGAPAAGVSGGVTGGAGVSGAGPAAGGAPAPAGTSSPESPVNLNTATLAELETLPGVGPSIAAAILAEREARGGFGSVRDLLDVRGIGESRLAQLEPLVTV